MGILARQNAVGQDCPTYILRLDKPLVPTRRAVCVSLPVQGDSVRLQRPVGLRNS